MFLPSSNIYWINKRDDSTANSNPADILTSLNIANRFELLGNYFRDTKHSDVSICLAYHEPKLAPDTNPAAPMYVTHVPVQRPHVKHAKHPTQSKPVGVMPGSPILFTSCLSGPVPCMVRYDNSHRVEPFQGVGFLLKYIFERPLKLFNLGLHF